MGSGSKKGKKIAIVDFDVHHGNGTQQIFYGRRDVLYISSHQFPFYPGTGSILETGSGEGEGYTVNFPLTAGRGDTFHLAVYAHLVDPILRSYEPDLILVSAGYDSHRRDPLGGMEVSTKGFGTLATILNQAAAQLCAGRILYFLEGGYDLEALAASVIETIGITLEPPEEFPSLPQVESAFEVYATQVKKVLGRYWKF